MKKIGMSILCGFILMTAVNAMAVTYKWKNPAGATVYSSTPPANKMLKYEVVKPSSPAPATAITPVAVTTIAPAVVAVAAPVAALASSVGLPKAPDHFYMSKVDLSKLLPSEPGTNELKLVQTSRLPVPSGTGEFRIACPFSHMSFDDPIVYPGKKGAAHLHVFFGNKDVNYLSTKDSIALSGDSTCQGGIANRSGYWVPAVIDTTTNAPVKPSGIMVYYKGADSRTSAYTKTPPTGLRMIAGSMSNIGPSTQQSAPHFYCDPSSTPNPDERTLSTALCKDEKHADGYIRKAAMVMVVTFPECWDGVNLDSADHKSHMAFGGKPTINGCPATHPVLLPQITYNIRYDIPKDSNPANWRLSSDMYPTTTPSGFSSHGDWFNGWKPEVLDLIVKKCIAGHMDCGSNFLPDGREMLSAQ